MEKLIQIRVTDQLFTQMENANEVHEKQTGIKQSISEFVRIAISEKLLRR